MKIIKLISIGTVLSFLTVPFCFAQQYVIPAMPDSWQTKAGIHFSEPTTFSLLTADRFNNKHSSAIKLLSKSPVIGYLVKDTTRKDTNIYTKRSDKKFRMKKSPWLAVLMSAVVPGLGQFYNESYWKIPIILGLTGYLGYQFYDNHKKYTDYRSQYAASQTPEDPYGNLYLMELREFYRNQRDDFIWYFAIVYVVNLVDAYIDAHLFDFDVREEKIERFGKVDKEYKLNLKVKF